MENTVLRTVSAYAVDEFIERKSRFIGHIAPAANEDEARAFVDRIREEHRSATHNCYAWVCGDNDRWQRSADAGEPAGTAGRPILEAIKRADLHNTVIVVTRYFGGILLGAGGLTRAYAKSAQVAINAAQLVQCIPARRYAVTFEYSWLGKVDACLRQEDIEPENRLFADQVCIIFAATDDRFAAFNKAITEASGGSIHVQDLGEETVLTIPVE